MIWILCVPFAVLFTLILGVCTPFTLFVLYKMKRQNSLSCYNVTKVFLNNLPFTKVAN